jgi:hypothetical protein
MNTTHNVKRIIAGALLSGGVAVAGSGLGAGTAQAWNGPHQWCPGQSMEWPTGPWGNAIWDMSVCHTFWGVGYGMGNVPNREGAPSSVWDGDDPPAQPPRQCMSLFLPAPCPPPPPG